MKRAKGSPCNCERFRDFLRRSSTSGGGEGEGEGEGSVCPDMGRSRRVMRTRAAAGDYRTAEGKRRSEGVEGVEERLAAGVKYQQPIQERVLRIKQNK